MKLFFAYLDAGTGSLIVQAIVGALVGVGVFFKTFRSRIVGFFKRDKGQVTPPAKKATSTKAPE